MRVIASIIFFGLVAWCAGFTLFIRSLPDTPAPASLTTDAIIVLTGGNGRVERGFAMLAEGAASALFISGVGDKVTLNELLAAHASDQTRAVIAQRNGAVMLGRDASTTRTNAEEVALFARSRSLYKLRLVTAHYHMPRSLVELGYTLPEATLIADPVFPDGFKRSEWWKHHNTRRLMLVEYHKYLVALMRMLV